MTHLVWLAKDHLQSAPTEDPGNALEEKGHEELVAREACTCSPRDGECVGALDDGHEDLEREIGLERHDDVLADTVLDPPVLTDGKDRKTTFERLRNL